MIFNLFGLISFADLVTVAQKLASSPIGMMLTQGASVQTGYKMVILSRDCTKAFWDPDAYSWWTQHTHKDVITYEDTTTSKEGWSWFRSYFDSMRDCSQTFWFSWNGSQAGWTCVIIWKVLVYSFCIIINIITDAHLYGLDDKLYAYLSESCTLTEYLSKVNFPHNWTNF